MLKVKVYADRMSQPFRAVLIFCKVNGIEFNEIKVEISKRQQLSPEFAEGAELRREERENFGDGLLLLGRPLSLPEESIILNALSATVDFTTCESIRMSQSVDKTGLRTLAVVTKADKSPEGLLEKVTADDVNWFESHPMLSKIDKSIVGVPVLAQRLVQVQGMIISKTLPEIIPSQSTETIKVEVEVELLTSLAKILSNKRPGDDLFDKLDTSKLNAHLKELMPGLTAKVFRTFNASITLDDMLNKETKEGDVVEKILVYQHANKQVAIICNHQRSVSKSHSSQIEKLTNKIGELQAREKDLSNQCKD
ncbi:DNA topoisomerase [Arachis hypogaea]|nr:DNA topoisomerase [Arachis hypogaea]